MALTTAVSPRFAVTDASTLVALVGKEPGTHPLVRACLDSYAAEGRTLYAPGVLVAEVLYALCRKLAAGVLTVTEHTQAIQGFSVLMASIVPPPSGDAALVTRAEEIQDGYDRSRSADGLYIALAEELTLAGATERLTLDSDLKHQAAAMAPTVTVRVLTPWGSGPIPKGGGGSRGPVQRRLTICPVSPFPHFLISPNRSLNPARRSRAGS